MFMKKKKAHRKKTASRSKTTTPRCKKTLDFGKLSEYAKTRAYYIWEEMGKPEGKDAEIWTQAEKDVRKQFIKK